MDLTIQTFDSVEAFLHSPRRERPACLVLDVALPGLSGLELQGICHYNLTRAAAFPVSHY